MNNFYIQKCDTTFQIILIQWLSDNKELTIADYKTYLTYCIV